MPYEAAVEADDAGVVGGSLGVTDAKAAPLVQLVERPFAFFATTVRGRVNGVAASLGAAGWRLAVGGHARDSESDPGNLSGSLVVIVGSG